MNRVLILTYYWPPAGGPGVQRWLKFVKYLEGDGWKPYVLTVKNGTYSAIDELLLKEIPEGLPVYKTKSRDPFRVYNMFKRKEDGSVSVALINIDKDKSFVDRLSMFIRSNFFIPDARKGWVPFAYSEALRIIREQKIDLLVTTGPPHSTHLAGLKIKKKTGIPWLADLRDPWTTVYYNDMLPRSKRTKRIDKKFEDEVIGLADGVSVVSPGMKSEFEGRNENIHVVMNGFDTDDMQDAAPKAAINGRFSLTYTGSFKPNQHIPHIWDGICELIDEHQDFAREFRLCFVGNLDNSVPDYFAAKGKAGNLEVRGYVPHAEITKIMASSGILLFVVPQSRNNKLIITGKLFEYLASGRPILSVGPADGDAAAILRDTGSESMLLYDDKEGFKKKLYAMYSAWKKGNLKHIDMGTLDRYTRQASARAMARLMNDLISEP